jgi:hypothetical protein
MRRITEGQYALGALTIFAVWIFVVLPLLYYPRQETPQNERGTAQGEQHGDSIGDEPPPLIALKLLTTAGRHEISAYCAQKPKNQSQDWTHGYICDVKITDAYLAWFNGLLVLVTGGLIGVGVLTIWKMRDTEERQLRAYVFAEIEKAQRNANGAWKFGVIYRNSGQTPAYDFSAWLQADVFNEPAGEENFVLKPGGAPFSVAPLPPGQFVTSEGAFDVLMAEYGEIRAGRKGFYVFGELTFIDAFKTKRRVRFRFVNNLQTGPGRMLYADRGNEEI